MRRKLILYFYQILFTKMTVNKLLSLMLLLMATMSFTACGSDDDENSAPSDPASALVGKWKVVSSDDDFFCDKDGNVEASAVSFEASKEFIAYDLNSRLLFDDDDKAYYKVGDGVLQIDLNCEGTAEKHTVDDYLKGKYTISGNTLRYTYKWYDGSGSWQGDKEFTLVLKK